MELCHTMTEGWSKKSPTLSDIGEKVIHAIALAALESENHSSINHLTRYN